MLIDANSLEAGTVLQAKYCVIGSGMAGSAIAHSLVTAGCDVLLLEAGGTELPAAGAEAVSAEHVGRDFNMPITRCIELGGTSNQWHGICAPLDENDFEARDWIPGSGWPITRSQLQPWYLEAAKTLEIPSDGWFEDSQPKVQGFEDIRLGCQGR